MWSQSSNSVSLTSTSSSSDDEKKSVKDDKHQEFQAERQGILEENNSNNLNEQVSTSKNEIENIICLGNSTRDEKKKLCSKKLSSDPADHTKNNKSSTPTDLFAQSSPTIPKPSTKEEEVNLKTVESQSKFKNSNLRKSLKENTALNTAERIPSSLLTDQTADTMIKRPTRPKTAKLGSQRSRGKSMKSSPVRKTSIPEKFGKVNRSKRNDLPSTSSCSSITTIDEEQWIDNEPRAGFADNINAKAREQLLHQYLDRHLEKHLDDQRSYFERGYSSRFIKSTGRKKLCLNSKRKMSSTYKDRLANSVYGNSAAILPSYYSVSKEADIKRNIKLLVSELAKHQTLNAKSPQALEKYKVRLVDQKHSRSRIKLKEENFSTSCETKSSSSGESYDSKVEQNPELPKTSKRRIRLIIPSDTGSDDTEKDNARHNLKKSSNRSILKSSLSATKQDGNEFYSSEKREIREERKNQKHLFQQDVEFNPSVILRDLGNSNYLMADNQGNIHRVILNPAPLHHKPPLQRYKSPSKQKTNLKNDFIEEKIKTKSSVQQSNEKVPFATKMKHRLKSAKSSKNLVENKDKSMTSPRIRPGNEPIKCNWDPRKSQAETKEPKFSDHQLKSSNNQEILDWLARKNMQAHKNHIHKIRENRSKRDKLMMEQNEKEDKKEQALVEYEKWKKRKNKEILLRRRKEISEANGEQDKWTRSFSSSAQNTNNTNSKDSSVTAYSDLRSTSVFPQPPSHPTRIGLAEGSIPRRPKSAPTKVSFRTPIATHAKKSNNFVPVKIDFENGDVTVVDQNVHQKTSNLSAREPIMHNSSKEPSNFMRKLLDSPPSKSMFDVAPPSSISEKKMELKSEAGKTISHCENKVKPNSFGREHYNEWMKSNGASSPYQMKVGKRKKQKNESRKPLPDHNPLSNELLSDLAKRRIKKILDQKKRVDSGLKSNRQHIEAQNQAKNDKVDSKPSIQKWRLGDMIEEVPQNNEQSSRNTTTGLNEQTVVNSKRKTTSKSIFPG